MQFNPVFSVLRTTSECFLIWNCVSFVFINDIQNTHLKLKSKYYDTTEQQLTLFLLIIVCADYFYVLYLKLYSRYTVLNIY